MPMSDTSVRGRVYLVLRHLERSRRTHYTEEAITHLVNRITDRSRTGIVTEEQVRLAILSLNDPYVERRVGKRENDGIAYYELDA